MTLYAPRRGDTALSMRPANYFAGPMSEQDAALVAALPVPSPARDLVRFAQQRAAAADDLMRRAAVIYQQLMAHEALVMRPGYWTTRQREPPCQTSNCSTRS